MTAHGEVIDRMEKATVVERSRWPNHRIVVYVTSIVLILLIDFRISVGFAQTIRGSDFVVLEGQSVPGTAGEFFSDFATPLVNIHGNVAFGGFFDSSQTGIFLSNERLLSAVAVQGQTIPGIGTLSHDFVWLAFNDRSTVVFSHNGISGGATTAAVFQKELGESLTAIVMQGDPAPGTNSGVFASFDRVDQNNEDDVAFTATYEEGGNFKSGVFLKPHNRPLIPIVLQGDLLPGTGGGSLCIQSSVRDINGPWLNNKGAVAFQASYICDAIELSGSMFIKQWDQPIQPFVLRGDKSRLPLGTICYIGGAYWPGLSNVGAMGLLLGISAGEDCTLAPDQFGIYVKKPGAMPLPCVMEGSIAPGTAGEFTNLFTPAMSQKGLLAFGGVVTDKQYPYMNYRGIFTCENGNSETVALQGQPKPGTSSTFGFGTVGFDYASLSDRGRVIFLDRISPTGVFESAH
ncbi:MAG: choice-of-anchor tandem repeat NxxGxxAF-containing protein [Dissulfurispiraceae bacterium]